MVRRMATRSSFGLVNRVAGGRLKRDLLRWRRAGDSYETIAYRLREKGIEVSRSTVHRWCRELGLEHERAAS
jgi:intein-encoded DNA endonuclease-like protein